MKNIIVTQSVVFDRKEIIIDDYNFIFNGYCDEIERKVGSIEKYARAIYMLVEKNDPTLLNDIGYIFYTYYYGGFGGIHSSSLRYFTSSSKISDIILEMQNPHFCCCKEILEKISELYFYEMKNK